ncbi:uncharacterized protein LOC110433637 [Sorghum bicolor]|uniref:uncharacterized protein LOC110433637 n=1 Tax=Sorghum bicolor TaxID=4558 RepID=UPI000B4257FF|nr:uncharacterized protein LOC110433637 [Sorghum bicolor]|eukprot:XP_021311813.1 uncharacterized protein LOC110433637 [Sorghum bicolor]
MAETDAERLAREAAEARRRQAEAARTAALDKYEADHADVHAAAIAVLNIKVLVPIVLDRVANNYNRWRTLFLVVLGKYALTDHVLTDVVNDDRPAWVQMNCTVLTWIYGTIHLDLQQSTMLKEPNACVAWVHLEDEFLGQRESRALLLSAEFRTVKQGASSIMDFYRRLETMAASLREFGDPVGDKTLVLTLLRGLSEKFRPMVTNIKLQQPFPSFSESRTLLLLEEIDINDFAGDTDASSSTTPTPPPPALLAGSSSGPGSAWRPLGGAATQPSRAPGGPPANAGQGNGSAGNQGGGRSGRRRGKNGKQQQHGQPQQQHHVQRPPMYTPWAGMAPYWAPPLARSTGRLQHPIWQRSRRPPASRRLPASALHPATATVLPATTSPRSRSSRHGHRCMEAASTRPRSPATSAP